MEIIFAVYLEKAYDFNGEHLSYFYRARTAHKRKKTGSHYFSKWLTDK
jgi:hypothetical protein